MTDEQLAPPPPPDAKDLNALVPSDRKALFGQPPVVYVVPGDMPMDIYLKTQLAMVEDDEVKATNLLHEALTDLLGYNLAEGAEGVRAKLDRDVRSLGVRTMMRLLNHIYIDDEDAEQAADAAGEASPQPSDPAPSPPDSTTSTTKPSPSEASPTLTETPAEPSATSS